MRRHVTILAIVGAILAPGYVSADPQPDTPNETSAAPGTEKRSVLSAKSTVDDYIDYAFQHNRGMKAARAKWRAEAEHAVQARYLEDPQLSLEYMFEKHDMQYVASLKQMIPGFGKLRLRKKIAASHASAAEHDYEALRLMVFENVIKAFYNYHYLGRAITVTDENVKLLTDLEKALLASYKANKTRYADLLKAQVEKDRLLDKLAGLKDMRSVRSAKLCVLLDLPVTTILPWPTATPSAGTTLDDDVLFDMLEILNPELKALDSTIAGLDQSVKLVKKSYTPDFVIGAGYMQMPKEDAGDEPTDASVTLGITLPIWWGKYRSAAREATLMHEAAVNRRALLEKSLLFDLKAALFDLRDAERQIKLLKESLIPKAEQAFKVAKQEFAGGTTTFMTLIDAQRTLFDFSLMLERAVADREIALGEIGCCVGKFSIDALAEDGSSEKQQNKGGQ